MTRTLDELDVALEQLNASAAKIREELADTNRQRADMVLRRLMLKTEAEFGKPVRRVDFGVCDPDRPDFIITIDAVHLTDGTVAEENQVDELSWRNDISDDRDTLEEIREPVPFIVGPGEDGRVAIVDRFDRPALAETGASGQKRAALDSLLHVRGLTDTTLKQIIDTASYADVPVCSTGHVSPHTVLLVCAHEARRRGMISPDEHDNLIDPLA